MGAKRTPITAAELAEVRKAQADRFVQEHVTAREAARFWGCTEAVANKRLCEARRRAGLTKPRVVFDVVKATQMIKEGASNVEIAKATGSTLRHVSHLCARIRRELGVTKRNTPRVVDPEVKEALKTIERDLGRAWVESFMENPSAIEGEDEILVFQIAAALKIINLEAEHWIPVVRERLATIRRMRISEVAERRGDRR
jgi:hypothetical protein